MTNPDLSLGPVLFMNERACFLWQRSLIKHSPWCISVLEFISIAPGCLPSFRGCFLFCKMYYLDRITSAPFLGDRNFCTQRGDLCTAAYVLFVVRLHSNAYFWAFPVAQLFLLSKISFMWTLVAKVRGKCSSIVHVNLWRRFTVICSFWLAWGSPGRSGHVRGWLLRAPRAAWFLWASPTPFHFAGDGEGKAVVFQLNFWGWEIGEKT